MLASSGLVTDEQQIVEIALGSALEIDERADAAASILGPNSTGKLIDALFSIMPQIRSDSLASKAYGRLETRLQHVPGTSLATALSERSPGLTEDQIGLLAALISRRQSGGGKSARPFDHNAVPVIQRLAEEWGRRLLASGGATRWQKAQIAWMACRVPGVELVKILRELLEDNLRRLRGYRAEVEVNGRRATKALDEVRTPMTHEYLWAFIAINAPEARAVMKEYLEDWDFGESAAKVLACHWIESNEPAKDTSFRSTVDWSGVSANRAARAASPAVTCDEAEAIFSAIERLLSSQPTPKSAQLAVALGVSALRLPHGQRSEVVRRLISVASIEGLEVSRAGLLLSLVLSGEEVDITDVIDGIQGTLESARTKHWMLKEHGGFHLKVWLRLLPFVNRPSDALRVILELPSDLRGPHFLDDLLYVFANSPSQVAAEEVLFGLADADTTFFDSSGWRHAVLSIATPSVTRRLVDLVASGRLNARSLHDWGIYRELGALLSLHNEVRRHVYGLLAGGAPTPGLLLLARAVAEALDEDGLLVLLTCEQQRQLRLSLHEIEQVVTERIPVDGYVGAFSVSPVRADKLRKRLFSMVGDGGRDDVAARWLTAIDLVRDEHGLPEDEPRHPDLASGRPWPVLADNVQRISA
jgi:hypothetical protein